MAPAAGKGTPRVRRACAISSESRQSRSEKTGAGSVARSANTKRGIFGQREIAIVSDGGCSSHCCGTVAVAGRSAVARTNMDDAIAARLQLLEDSRQGGDGPRLNVVQQQDALSLGLQPLDREIVDPRRRNVPPVVRREIRAPDLDALRGRIFLDAVGA